MEPNKYELEDLTENELDIEIVDDTPEDDKGRIPVSPEKVKALEVDVDELDKYSKDAKDKMIQMKRVWNDERRRADAADRERSAAVEAAQALFEENKKIKEILNSGEKEYVDAVKTTTSLQLEMAKKAYKDAYDMGDTDKLLEAQEEMTRVAMQMDKIKNFKLPPLQEENIQVQREQYQQPAKPDDKVMEWQERNSWFGQDEEMTASALGLHEKLKNGGVVVGSDEYYARLDETMRRRFPENFEEEAKEDVPRRNTVVAPATRSTAPRKLD